MNDIGHQIYLTREAKGMGQSKLARLAGIPQPNLSNIEKGKKDFTVFTLIRLAHALGVPPAQFFSSNETAQAAERPRFSRDRIERLARAVLDDRMALHGDEKKWAELWRQVMPSKLKKGASPRKTQTAWAELRAVWSPGDIKAFQARVADAEERRKGQSS